jgi:hypothetical protein
MTEERLKGGYQDGAVRVADTVRRSTGPWTPAVHALLAHLADKGFTGAPRPLGFDERGREVLTFLEGETIGNRKPRPARVHAEDTLDQVARWMRACHQAVADFVPPPGAVWRGAAPGNRACSSSTTTRPPSTPPGTGARSPGSSTGTSSALPPRSGT